MGSTTVQAPAPVNPAQVGAESLATQISLAPQQYAAEAQFRPQYAALDAQIARDQMPALMDLYRQATAGLGAMQTTANTAQREADIADVARLAGPALDAYRAANPELQTTMRNLTDRVNAGRQTPELLGRLTGDATASLGQVTPLQLALQKQAMEQLSAGGALTPQEQQQIQQDTRAAYAARGLYDSNQAMGAEILNTDAARRTRFNQALQFAQGVDQAALQQQQANRQYATSISELGRTASADQYGREYSLAGLFQQQAQDPYQLVLGRSGAVQQGVGAGQMAQAGANAGPQMFNPFNSDIMNIYSANNANQLAASTATANNRASMFGSVLGAAGMLGGAAILGCWVAREIYGNANPRWLVFRSHLYRHAPRRLFNAYLRHGPALAARIREDLALRARVQDLLEAILAKSPVTA